MLEIRLPPNTSEEADSAMRSLRRGATSGMVRRELQGRGLTDQTISDVIRWAQWQLNRRRRLRGLLVAMAGLALAAAGIAAWVALSTKGRLGQSSAIVIMMAGILLSVYGFFELIHATRLSRALRFPDQD